MNMIDAEHRVPAAWRCAQETARILIDEGGLRWPRASFGYRATHAVLALSVLLACPSSGKKLNEKELSVLQMLVNDDVEWAVWCEGRLGLRASHFASPDLIVATSEWQWLANSHLLRGSFPETVQACQETLMRRGVGVNIGVTHARRLLDAHRA
ncbi:hypothetical protein [Streptomyces sp. NPDC088847]|uniref:hypothetical protein n=1 Tax=Streptomyces sp. NPDC088847 TaxID=3365909 RepID=UPI00381384C0